MSEPGDHKFLDKRMMSDEDRGLLSKSLKTKNGVCKAFLHCRLWLTQPAARSTTARSSTTS